MTKLYFYTCSIILLPLIAIFCLSAFPDSLSNPYPHQYGLENVTDSDVLIIGGSHAGLSAALTLAQHQIEVLVFDMDAPRNKWRTPTHALPTWENQSPDKIRQASRKELVTTGFIRFIQTQLVKFEKKNITGHEFFEVGDSRGRTWRGKKLLVAAGVEFVFPTIEGYEDNFPDHILHCLFTRGLQFRGSSSAGLLAMGLAGQPSHAAMLVEDAQKFADTVTVYTNGADGLGDAIHKTLTERGTENIEIDSRKLIRLTRDRQSPSIMIEFEDGATRKESFLVHQPDTQVNQEVVNQLGLETNARGDITTKMPFYQTNASGVFAAGDCASPFKMIPNSIFQGSNAGAGIARELPRRITGHETNRPQGWL